VVERKSESNNEEFAESVPNELDAGELVLGALVGIDDGGHPQVTFDIADEHYQAVMATATIEVLPKHIGRQVALMFLAKDIAQPVILGFIHSPLYTILDPAEVGGANTETDAERAFGLEVDGEKSKIIEAEETLVLRCGEASITLNKSGKILLRGKYLVSRSSGVNRILGGSVQVN